MVVKSHNLRMPDELFTAIDAVRGEVPRNTWIVSRLAAMIEGPQAKPGKVTPITAQGPLVREIKDVAARKHRPTCTCPVCKPARNKPAPAA
jgi:hypothetical protein